MSIQTLASQIGRIKTFDWAACAPSPLVMVTTAVDAALHAFWTVVEPDPKELYHRAAGESLVKTLKVSIDEAGELHPVLSGRSRSFLFSAAELADMAVWYLFLADVLVEGLIKWESMMIQASPCTQHPTSGYWSDGPSAAFPDGGKLDESSGCVWLGGSPAAFYPALTVVPGQAGQIIAQNDAWNGNYTHQYPMISRVQEMNSGSTLSSGSSTDNGDGSFGFPAVNGRVMNFSSDFMQLQYQCAVALEGIPLGEGFPLSGSCRMWTWHI